MDLRRLGHPDPIGQTGQQDCLGHRGDVAVAFGQRVVEVDEAVGRRVDQGSDLRGQGVGELRCRADQDGPRFEFEDPTTLDRLGEPVRETDVARPQQPLVFGGLRG